MTLSAVDNPYGLIGADSMDADKGAKNSAFSSNSDLFSRLLSTTGVQQVAYSGSNDEFDETLNMRDQTVAHDAKMGEDSLKYESLGLAQGDAAVIESTRMPRELKSQQDSSSEATLKKGLHQRAKDGNDKDNSDNGNATIGNSAELLLRSSQNQISAVDETRSANALEARRASDAQLLRPDAQVSRTAAAPAQVKPVETIAMEELPKSRYATSQPQSSNASSTSNQQKTGIKVTKVQEDMLSQPTSSLTASVALAIQTDKPAKPALETLTALAEDLDGEARPPLASTVNVGRPARPQPTQSNMAQPHDLNGGMTSPSQQTVPTPLPPQVTQQAQMAAATSVRPDVSVQTGQPIADPVTGGPSTHNNGQQTQRTQQSEAPRPARPPVPPQEVTNQVAVQIKKAIGQGSDQIRIQLKPAELGKVEVKLEVTDDGRAVAAVSAERPETLDLLQRDTAGLRQALQDAGLNTDSKSLSFNLQGEGSKFEQEMADRGQAPRNNDEKAKDAKDLEELSAEESALLAAEVAASDGRVNVQV